MVIFKLLMNSLARSLFVSVLGAASVVFSESALADIKCPVRTPWGSTEELCPHVHTPDPKFRGRSPEIFDCTQSFSPEAFHGRTGKVAFYNDWAVSTEVVLYHPNSGSIYNTYTVAPRQNLVLGNIVVGDDWGVCVKYNGSAFRSGFVNNLGTISIYNPNYQGSPLFMIQNDRIR
ncbi:MAG: hypothetical protein ACK5BG_18675 [Pseudanabaena sp.]